MMLNDKHDKECNCSYCATPGLHYGLNVPKVKAWNSWWVIKYWPGRYFRFTAS